MASANAPPLTPVTGTPVADWLAAAIFPQKLLETAFAKDGIAIRRVQSAGSNKALEFLNAGSPDFGSTAEAAALIGEVNGGRGTAG